MHIATIALIVQFLVEIVVVVRIILRPHREPTSRFAWIAVVATVPVFGVLVYILFGEVNIGRKRTERVRRVNESLPPLAPPREEDEARFAATIPEKYAHLFATGLSISGFQSVGGNQAALMADSNAAVDAMVADIDAAQNRVHVLFYIWLDDNNGRKVRDALIRAAQRGVACRAIADSIGSRAMIASQSWKEMKEAGVMLAEALKVGNPFLRLLKGRIDLRNHRKITVIDGTITYCGSQNCADPEFRVKPKYAPWVDALVRFEGPLARQNEHLFVGDWMSYVDEDLLPLLEEPIPVPESGLSGQVIGTGPTVRNSAMPELFETLMHAARQELVITTPYYVPNEAMQTALCAAAHRGVETTIIFPARNDSRVVAAASESYYEDLLKAGVRIFEYEGGLLHTKSLTLDGAITLIGSANMDRRSFDLNYENNILVSDPTLTRTVRERQDSYLKQSHPVTLEMVAEWGVTKRLWNNAIAILGPVL